MRDLDCRPYESGDESKILQLFAASYGGRTMTNDHWRWRFLDNPAGQAAIELAWQGGELVGHYAVVPVVLAVRGREMLTGLSVTAMIHPRFRRRGLFPFLAKRAYAGLARDGCVAVWGFPNPNSHRGHVRELGWKDLREIPILQLELVKLPLAFHVSSNVVELRRFDERFDDFWRNVQSLYPLLVRRNREYLTWRFTRRPDRDCRILGFIRDNELLGYAVFMSYLDEHCQIVDILTVNDNSVGRQLVVGVASMAREDGLKTVRLWLPSTVPLHWELEKLAFENVAPITYLGALVLNQRAPGIDCEAFYQWYYTMSDSDVF